MARKLKSQKKIKKIKSKSNTSIKKKKIKKRKQSKNKKGGTVQNTANINKILTQILDGAYDEDCKNIIKNYNIHTLVQFYYNYYKKKTNQDCLESIDKIDGDEKEAINCWVSFLKYLNLWFKIDKFISDSLNDLNDLNKQNPSIKISVTGDIEREFLNDKSASGFHNIMDNYLVKNQIQEEEFLIHCRIVFIKGIQKKLFQP